MTAIRRPRPRFSLNSLLALGSAYGPGTHARVAPKIKTDSEPPSAVNGSVTIPAGGKKAENGELKTENGERKAENGERSSFKLQASSFHFLVTINVNANGNANERTRTANQPATADPALRLSMRPSSQRAKFEHSNRVA
ncbi:hypothetical protein B0H15DRAFT_796127 [Mycena belliarum]|uniref:Uncharacterized protein n=1 Tax=Mycena belliarum TaxID=1033014 RepID=A0AAD6UJU3_9AGAR|nr:hypothetical protein B0H15DRAFT_796127 [Mycena belliae]